LTRAAEQAFLLQRCPVQPTDVTEEPRHAPLDYGSTLLGSGAERKGMSCLNADPVSPMPVHEGPGSSIDAQQRRGGICRLFAAQPDIAIDLQGFEWPGIPWNSGPFSLVAGAGFEPATSGL